MLRRRGNPGPTFPLTSYYSFVRIGSGLPRFFQSLAMTPDIMIATVLNFA